MTAFDRLTRANFAAMPVTCTDGAWGTQLQALGAQPGELTDGWNVSAPDKVLSVAAAYVDAGAGVILTNTFSSNRVVLARHGMEASAAALTRAGAEISRRAAGSRALVFGSIGPTGKLIALKGIDAAVTAGAAAEQAKALAEGGADAIVIETQSALEDARAALDGALAACDLPVGVTFSFDSGRDNTRTMMGVRVSQVYEMARSVGASFVGANCGAGIDATIEVARQFQACGGDLPVWIKGNAGAPTVDADGATRYDAPVDLYATHAPALVEAGVRFVGGCCGSTPAHIAALAARLRELAADCRAGL
jgi:5-methyltetrahydrofolate--homocysteine methyltransferase